MATFRRSRNGLFSLTLQPVEADVLASVTREVLELLDVPERRPDPLAEELGLGDLPGFGALADSAGGPAAPPEDDVLRRLLPDAYPEDPDAAAEFRRFTEHGLRERKAAAARAVLASLAPVEGQGGRVQLDADGARTWLAALNDVRLALGTRLGVSDDSEPELLGDDDPERYAWAVYDFATHLQETLVRSLG
ncbi:DUF2017 domain-containing protein [Kineococcus auxinigenes]|uniref:DUF2017 domain-containing protein n=1 Tax=unclassified Kineococcus TaxID=2621656 RepID=UPI003D7E98B8